MTDKHRSITEFGSTAEPRLMPRVATCGRWAGELAVPVMLVPMILRTSRHETLIPILTTFPILLAGHWVALKHSHARLDLSTRRLLSFATGPSALQGLALVLTNNAELKAGAATKEMQALARNEGVPSECEPLWRQDHVARWKSERLLAGLLCASYCLLYASRLSAGARDEKACPREDAGEIH